MIQNEQSDVRLLNWFTGILAFVVVVWVAKTLSDLILPIFLSFLLARLLRPLALRLTKFKLPYSLSVMVVTVCCLGIIALIVVTLALCGSMVADTIPAYMSRIESSVAGVQLQIHQLMQNLGIADEAVKPAGLISTSTIISIASSTIGSTMSLVSHGLIIFILVLMILGSGDAFNKAVLVAYGQARHANIVAVVHSIDIKVEQFLLSKSLVNLLSGTMVTVVLLIFGVDLAFVFGVITFFLTFIPTIGGLIALGLPVGLAYLQFGGGGLFTGVVVCLIIGNLVIDRIIEPMVMGKSMNLSTVVVFLAFIFFSWMWGAMGAILAVPVTAMLKVLCESVPKLRPIAILMGEN